MADVYRRIIVKPPGVDPEVLSQLAQRLKTAIERQRKLASQSPHILQFLGELNEDDHSYFVRHEPATPIAVTTLFDTAATPMDERSLLRSAAAIADALRAAHDRSRENVLVHGGLCGGVLLQTPEGIRKLTDFGFAPAICAALGVEQYLELAVGPCPDDDPTAPCTGRWEVLSPDEFERDDRLCGFIDPDKYGSGILDAFETGSDIVGAGILLHLLAERRHPFLADAEDHRMVVTAESMAWRPFNGARRKELRESSDPAVRRWCELVEGMLARIPADRPSAETISTELALVDVKPVDATELIRRQVEAAVSLSEQEQWDDLDQALAGLADPSALSAELGSKVERLHRQVEAYRCLQEARDAIHTDQWRHVKDKIDRLDTGVLPTSLRESATALAAALQASLSVHEDLIAIEVTLNESTESDPVHSFAVLGNLLQRLETVPIGETVVEAVRHQKQQLLARLTEKKTELAPKIEAVQADHALVTDWFEKLEQVWNQEQWDDVDTLLRARPETPHWPREIKHDTRELENRYAEVKRIRAWMETIEGLLAKENIKEIEALLTERPAVDQAPMGIRRAIDDLADRIDKVKAKAADAAEALKWIETVESAVKAEDWPVAQERLLARPSLSHWPKDILQRETETREEVEARLAERERVRLAVETWLNDVDRLAQEQAWDQALERLATPPLDAKQLSKEIKREIKTRQTRFKTDRAQAQRHALERRNQSVHDLMTRLVADLLGNKFADYLDPARVHISVSTVDWDDDDAPTAGKGDLQLSIRDGHETDLEMKIERPFQIRMDGDRPRLRDHSALSDDLASRVTDFLRETQKRQFDRFLDRFREGLFPQVTASYAVEAPTVTQTVALHPLGSESKQRPIDTELSWEVSHLDWSIRNTEELSKTLRDLAAAQTRDKIKPVILKQASLIQTYEPVVRFRIGDPEFEPSSGVPVGLVFRIELALSTTAAEAHRDHVLGTVRAVTKRVGHIEFGDDLGKMEAALGKLVVEAQERSRRAVEADLRSRIKTAKARIKVMPQSGRITQPVQTLRFTLRPKQRETTEVMADWSIQDFRFFLADESQALLTNLLTDPELTAAETNKRAMAIGGTLLATAAVVVFLVVNSGGAPGVDHPVNPRSTETPSIDLTNQNQNAATQPSTPEIVERNENVAPAQTTTTTTVDATSPPPPADAILAKVQAVLDQSDDLSNDDRLDVHLGESTDPRHLAIAYTIPGLPARQPLDIPLNDRNEWDYSQVHENQIKDGIRLLEGLLKAKPAEKLPEEIKTFLARSPLNPFIQTSRIQTNFDSEPDWLPGGNGWEAIDTRVEILQTLPDEQTVSLGILNATLTVQDGGLTINLPDDLEATIRANLTTIQADSLDRLRNDLYDKLKDLSTNPQIETDRAQSEQLISESSITLNVDPVLSKTFTAAWDPAELRFTLDRQVDQELRDLTRADRQLTDLVGLFQNRTHWIGRIFPPNRAILSDQFFLADWPQTNAWTLGIRFPWRDDQPPRNRTDGLRIPVTINADGSPDLNNPPRYWPLVTRLLDAMRTPFFLRETADLSSLADSIQNMKTAQPDTAPSNLGDLINDLHVDHALQSVFPRVSVPDKAQPEPLYGSDGETLTGFRLPVRIRFGVPTDIADRVPGMDIDKLDHTVAGLQPSAEAQQATMNLSLSPGSSNITMSWTGLNSIVPAMSGALTAVESLNRAIASFAPRRRVETRLDKILSNEENVAIDPAGAMDVLVDMWDAKGIANKTRAPETLDALIAMRQKRDSNVFSGKKWQVMPTALVEYFAGPDHTYALVISANPDGTPNGSSLVRLCRTSWLVGVEGKTDPKSLGSKLLIPVMDSLDTPDGPIAAGNAFDNQLGIVLGSDEMLPDDLESLPLSATQRDSELSVTEEGVGDIDSVQWASLAELEQTDRKAAFAILPSLISTRKEASPDYQTVRTAWRRLLEVKENP